MDGILETLMNATKITVGRMDSIVKFQGVEVTKNFVEFVFENCSEDRAIELANFITDKKKGGTIMEKIYMFDEVENIREFDSLEAAKEFIKTEEPVIVNYATFYRAPAGLDITTRIAAEGQLLAYGYDIMNQ